LSRIPFGKNLRDACYCYWESLQQYDNEIKEFINSILAKSQITSHFNVIKFGLTEFKISLLYYPNFHILPHPELKTSIVINLATGKIRKIDYANSSNPPILHRKEALLTPDHPSIAKYESLTKSEEQIGLYQTTTVIGLRKNWERLLSEKGLTYKGHKLISQLSKSYRVKPVPQISRHKTAIKRYNFSKPVQTLYENSFIEPGTTFFDYGCGKGDDIHGLKNIDIEVSGWDPVLRPEGEKTKADIVNLGFVLNVIENQIERADALKEAFSLTKTVLSVSTIVAQTNSTSERTPYKDGILTKRKTFQKYFSQNELRSYIESVLETTAVAVGPGIFYVFKSPVEQQEFLSKRNKRKINWEELSRKFYPDRAERLRLKRDALYEKNKHLLDQFWEMMLDFGRLPKKNEIEYYDKLKLNFGTPNAAKNFFIEKYGDETLKAAFTSRKDDLLVYLSLSNFKNRVPFKHLSLRLQNDIKTFLGSYKDGLEQSRQMLFSIGKPEIITALCSQTKFGFFDHKALYIHKSLMNDLHPILRIYIGCAGILYGDFNEIDIIKIHKRSGKVTLLKYDNFDDKNLPELNERIKVNLRKQHIDFFDHQSGPWQQLLYYKERFVASEHPARKKWEKFSKKLRKLGFNENDPIGPSKQEFLEQIEEKGLTINLNKRRKQKTNWLNSSLIEK